MKTILTTALIAAAMIGNACTHSVSDTGESAAVPTPTTSTQTASSGVIMVNVDGYKVQDGAVSAALFDEAGYKGKAAPLRGQTVDVVGERVTLIFKGLPAGEYGIKMYHDIDKNGEMNTNAIGLPTESSRGDNPRAKHLRT